MKQISCLSAIQQCHDCHEKVKWYRRCRMCPSSFLTFPPFSFYGQSPLSFLLRNYQVLQSPFMIRLAIDQGTKSRPNIDAHRSLRRGLRRRLRWRRSWRPRPARRRRWPRPPPPPDTEPMLLALWRCCGKTGNLNHQYIGECLWRSVVHMVLDQF